MPPGLPYVGGVGGFAADNYCSSLQNDPNSAWNQNFDNAQPGQRLSRTTPTTYDLSGVFDTALSRNAVVRKQVTDWWTYAHVNGGADKVVLKRNKHQPKSASRISYRSGQS